jgi:hypothetical protein
MRATSNLCARQHRGGAPRANTLFGKEAGLKRRVLLGAALGFSLQTNVKKTDAPLPLHLPARFAHRRDQRIGEVLQRGLLAPLDVDLCGHTGLQFDIAFVLQR